MPSGPARGDELSANLPDTIRTDADLCSDAFCKIDKIKMAGPSRNSAGLPVALSFALDFATIIPNKIDRARISLKALATGLIFYSKFVREKHFDRIARKSLHKYSTARATSPHDFKGSNRSLTVGKGFKVNGGES
jgi:hypothetical protein